MLKELTHNKANTRKMIIYCRSIKAVGQLFQFFMQRMGNDIYIGNKKSAETRLVAMFHHATKARIKKVVASTFPKINSNVRVIIATLAFGLGIDCPDVSFVINWGASRTFEGFYQESGRAGRNPDMQAYSIVYYHKSDVSRKATDIGMRNYCYAEDTKNGDDTSENDSDLEDIEDLFGTVKDAGTYKPKNSSPDTNSVCRRVLISEHLTPKQPMVHKTVLHECCDLCHKQCACENCPGIPGVDFITNESATARVESGAVPFRDVTDLQKSQLKLSLESLRDGYQDSHGFFHGELRSGIDVKTINDIVANAHHIFEEADLTEYVYDSAISAKVMERIKTVLDI